MATTSRGTPRGTTKHSTTTRTRKPAARSTSSSATESTLEPVKKTVGGYGGSFIKAVRARPYAAAAIAAGAAGAGTFLWAKRALIGEQAGVASEKLAELRDQASDKASVLKAKASEQAGVLKAKAGEQATSLRGKFNERFFAADEATGFDPVAEAQRSDRASKKTQSELAEEALTLKETGKSDPMIAEQIKVGAVSY